MTYQATSLDIEMPRHHHQSINVRTTLWYALLCVQERNEELIHLSLQRLAPFANQICGWSFPLPYFYGHVVCSVADSSLTSVSWFWCPDIHTVPRNDLNDYPRNFFSVKLSGPSISSRKRLSSPLLSDSHAHRKGFRGCGSFPPVVLKSTDCHRPGAPWYARLCWGERIAEGSREEFLRSLPKSP